MAWALTQAGFSQWLVNAMAGVPGGKAGFLAISILVLVILAIGIGLVAPPFDVGFYGACAIGRISPDDALWRIWPYIGALVAALIIVAAFPWLSVGFLR